jgi:hypothetical protein
MALATRQNKKPGTVTVTGFFLESSASHIKVSQQTAKGLANKAK